MFLPLETPPGTLGTPTWEVLGGVLAGVAALFTALVGGVKVLGELRQLRRQADKTAADAAAVLAQQHPNHGSSMRDGLNRVERLVEQVAGEQAAIRAEQRRHNAELARVHNTIGAVGERITAESARTAHELADHANRIGVVETHLFKKETK